MTTEQLYEVMPFARVLGIELAEGASAEKVSGSVAWSPERCTVGGLLHGAVVMGLADACGALCAALNLPEGATDTATLESKTNLLRGVREGAVTATSRPLHRGRATVVVETEVRDGASRLVAKTTQTQAVLR